MFTRSSVHWADRMVAATSSKGLRWCSAQVASGCAFSSRSRIWEARFTSARGVDAACSCGERLYRTSVSARRWLGKSEAWGTRRARRLRRTWIERTAPGVSTSGSARARATCRAVSSSPMPGSKLSSRRSDPSRRVAPRPPPSPRRRRTAAGGGTRARPDRRRRPAARPDPYGGRGSRLPPGSRTAVRPSRWPARRRRSRRRADARQRWPRRTP